VLILGLRSHLGTEDEKTNMICDISNILADMRDFSISPDHSGISYRGKRINWDDISEIYVFSKSTNFNFTFYWQNTEIKLINKDGMEIELYFSYDKIGFIPLSYTPKSANVHNEKVLNIYNYIISKIISRQWKELIWRMESGEEVSFKEFIIAKNYIKYRSPARSLIGITRRLLEGEITLDLKRVYELYINGGNVWIDYRRDNGSVKSRYLGELKNVPNFHLAQFYIKSISNRK
jgi:hypothetical protein